MVEWLKTSDFGSDMDDFKFIEGSNPSRPTYIARWDNWLFRLVLAQEIGSSILSRPTNKDP